MSTLEHQRLHFLERAVWAAAGMIIILTALSSSKPTWQGALVGALAAAINHTALQTILTRVIHQPGPGRLLYLLIYIARFSVLALIILWALKRWQVSAAGLALGFCVYPIALVLLIVRELLR
jgi:hypothetical protein